jgi:hypothetical protein
MLCGELVGEGLKFFWSVPRQLAFGLHWNQCGTVRQKAMGEALFGLVFAELAQSGIRGAPSSGPLIFVGSAFPPPRLRPVTSCELALQLTDHPSNPDPLPAQRNALVQEIAYPKSLPPRGLADDLLMISI